MAVGSSVVRESGRALACRLQSWRELTGVMAVGLKDGLLFALLRADEITARQRTKPRIS